MTAYRGKHRRKHRHEWVLRHQTISGWAVYHCRCGREELG